MAGAAKPRSRPLSPHLQVWRWHVTMAASILHRASGVALYVGGILLAAWLAALAAGPDTYAVAEAIAHSIWGQLVMYGFSVAVAYHLANGIRHLAWDSGHGFRPATADATGWFAIVFALAAPIGVWALANL